MTDEEIEKLSNVIVEKLVARQKELDKEFIKDLEASGVPIEVHEKLSKQDKIVMEITRLHVLLDQLEKAENYEECAQVFQRIEYLKGLIDELGK